MLLTVYPIYALIIVYTSSSFPRNFWHSRENNPNLSTLSLKLISPDPCIILVSLLCALSKASTSLRYWDDQNCTQYSKNRRTKVLYNYIMTS